MGSNSFQLLCSDEEERSEQQVNDTNINDFEWDNTGTELPRHAEKRQRDEMEEINDGFVAVESRSKRLARSYSKNGDSNAKKMSNKSNAFEVCLTSSEALPKQIAFAKLLSAENITNMLRIKYKGPYKVFVQFDTQEQADKLLNCKKIKELGYKCQMTTEINYSYGIVKQIDLDMKEEEIREIFKCEYKIVSVKRLKRLTDEGKWVDSETIRVCFNSSTLPPYIHGYDCRFKVEPYTFPVTQCSKCWKYGHLIRFCPNKKAMCPKCGKEHENCETTNYSCLNCRGNHMALDKSCPSFKKEKEIRKIISSDSCSYRKAYEKYQQKEHALNNEITSDYSDDEINQMANNTPPTYRDIVVTKAIVHEKNLGKTTNKNSAADGPLKDCPTINKTQEKGNNTRNGKKKKKTQKEAKDDNNFDENMSISEKEHMHNKECTSKSEKQGKSKFKIVIMRVKEIIMSEETFQDKIQLIVKFLIEELIQLVGEIIGKGNIFNNLLSFAYG